MERRDRNVEIMFALVIYVCRKNCYIEISGTIVFNKQYTHVNASTENVSSANLINIILIKINDMKPIKSFE